jgi:hypothetical protein
MKYYVALAICCIAACIQLPAIKNGKLDIEKAEPVPVWAVDEYVDDVMESKGYKRPVSNLDDESALWLWIAGLCALGGIAAFVGGYLSHWNKLCVVGAMLGLCSLVATGISAIVGLIGWIVGALLIAALCFLGWKLRNHKIQAFR